MNLFATKLRATTPYIHRYMVTQIRAASAADHLLCGIFRVRSSVKIALIRDKKIEELIKSNYIIYVYSFFKL